ncbi:hypothetical protein K488DRAFT_41696 [Vararia minispora EC-137]|uniref:Uncharacterized protein n=1 Tax=Vararia minispora EC-137 TaxID=1314806 RepID=A0ACB8QWM2_9AGAM|nr:hypothetical protein K488DRAFT_41696 [Vararia minispora EC-137]
MSSIGSIASSSAPARLTVVASHLSTARRKVVVSRDLGPDAMQLLRDNANLEVVLWPEDRVCDRSWLLENVPGSTGLIVLFTEKASPSGPGLKVVSTMSVGYEHVNLPALHKRGLRLGFTPDVLTDAVADVSVMLALMASRNAAYGVTLVHQGQWPPFAPFTLCGPQISTMQDSPTRTVGFLGFGRIAQATLARLVAFGITHCVYTSNPGSPPKLALESSLLERHPTLREVRRVDLDTVARESDVLFVLAPGGESTKHIVNEGFLRKMKKSSVLVNTARGTLVDSDALAKALREEWIWGAGLDVLEGEPCIDVNHPLLTEPRCAIVPHIGSATFDTRVGMAVLAARNLLGALNGTQMPAELDLASRLR